MRKPFRFKQFFIKDAGCAMKVSTDAVLLGSWVNINYPQAILDVGSGSGIIAMMIAQRSTGLIDAIEIDKDSAEDSKFNFETCPWSERLKVFNLPFSKFIANAPARYDLIVCNPPFFNNCLKSPSAKVNISRHTISLSHTELIAGSKKLLTPTGKLNIILPGSEFQAFLELATLHEFSCSRKCLVFPKPKKPHHRVLAEFGFQKPDNIESSEIIIRESDEKYHQDYIDLTKDFYINF